MRALNIANIYIPSKRLGHCIDPKKPSIYLGIVGILHKHHQIKLSDHT